MTQLGIRIHQEEEKELQEIRIDCRKTKEIGYFCTIKVKEILVEEDSAS
jgi:hypothetical protein